MRAVLTLAGVALACALGAPAALAQEAQEPGKKTEKIVIVERAGPQADGQVHRFRVEGGDEFIAKCDGTKDEVAAASPDGKERTRIVLCGHTQLSAAERAEKLEHVLSRLEAREDLTAEQKARVTAALREAIDRVRAGQ
jgi:hypothetical protein